MRLSAFAIAPGRFARYSGSCGGCTRGSAAGLRGRSVSAGRGGAAGPGLKPVLDLGEFRHARVGAGRLARMLY